MHNKYQRNFVLNSSSLINTIHEETNWEIGDYHTGEWPNRYIKTNSGEMYYENKNYKR